MARVTIDDLAARLGISRASVSYALNGRPGVGEETRSRVLALAMELGWQPSVSARSLSRSRADALGIVLSRRPEDLGSEPYYMALLSGIESALSEAGTSLMIRFVPPDGESEAAVYRRWNAERRVDGVILTDLGHDDARPGLLGQLALPFLVHGGRSCQQGWEFDQAADAQLVIDHLAELGHTEIAHVTGPSRLMHETERNIAILAGAERHGIRVTTTECDYSLAGARAKTAALLRRKRRPTAIVYSNDLMAVGGAAVLREADHDQTTVVAWDDSLLCQTAAPGITALQRDAYSAGRDTAHELIAIIEGKDAPQRERQPTRLVVRASSRTLNPA
jgi:DNA-binding LacI/PurR family transcriptional regulator